MVIFTSFSGTPRCELSTTNGRMRLVRTVPSFSIFGEMFVALFIT